MNAPSIRRCQAPIRPREESDPAWGSFSHWLDSQNQKLDEIDAVRFERSGLSLIRTHQREAFTDEPTPDLVLQYLSSGHCRFGHFDMGFGRADGAVQQGNWILVPPHCRLELDGGGDFRTLMMAVPFEPLSVDLARFAGEPVQDFAQLHAGFHNQDPFVSAALRQLWWQHRESELFADSMMTMILVRLMQLTGHLKDQSNAARGLSEDRLKQALEYLHANAETQASCLSELADQADLSRFQLIRGFKASTGSTPHEYLVRLRVELGKRRLLAGDSATSAAVRSGFYDQAHFTRQFKKTYGIPPGRYQRECHR